MDDSVFGFAAFSDHHMFAFPADDLSGKNVVQVFFFEGCFSFVSFIDNIDCFPEVIRDNAGEKVVIYDALDTYCRGNTKGMGRKYFVRKKDCQGIWHKGHPRGDSHSKRKKTRT